MRYFFLVIFIGLAVLISSCQNQKNKTADLNNNVFDTTVYGSVKFRVETFEVAQGFGYSIFINQKKMIYQDKIPAVEGNKVFKTKDDAMKTGKFVAQKMIQFPGDLPSLTVEELQQLNVIN